jgi:hypothetical protein
MVCLEWRRETRLDTSVQAIPVLLVLSSNEDNVLHFYQVNNIQALGVSELNAKNLPRTQSYDFDLQRQRCKNLQRN